MRYLSKISTPYLSPKCQMAAELQPPGSPVSNPGPLEVPSAPTMDNPGPSLAPKRHRRPSVRLGDIGDQPATLRTPKSWRLIPNPGKSSKTRPLTNLVTANGNFNPDYSPDTTTINNEIGNSLRKDFKSRRTTTTTSSKRLRTANLRIDELLPGEEAENGGTKINNDADGEEGFRDFDPEDSEQEHEPHSPVHSADDMANLDAWHSHNRRSIRVAAAARVSDSNPDFGLDGFPESNSRNRGLNDGVRNWLVGLGLARYAPVFEIHEVDDEVLPHLTLEDLKDMGINAVGSRRKLYSAIQKIQKGLS